VIKPLCSVVGAAFMGLAVSTPSFADPSPKGLSYWDFMESFVVGDGVEMGKEPTSKGLGLPKNSVWDALSLGDGGKAIGGYTNGGESRDSIKCFRDVPGNDFYVFEAQGSNILAELIEVFVNPSKNHYLGTWISLGIAGASPENKGVLGFDIQKAGLSEAYWVMVVDLNSKESSSVKTKAGFDLSTIGFRDVCETPTSYNFPPYRKHPGLG